MSGWSLIKTKKNMYLFRFSQCMSTSSDTFNKQNCKRKKSIGLILLIIARKLRILMGLDYASRFALQLVAGLYLALRNTRNWSASSLATSTCVILRLLRPANIAQGKRHCQCRSPQTTSSHLPIPRCR